MKMLLVAQVAKKWNITENTVRNYCNKGYIIGAIKEGRVWKIPNNAKQPITNGKKINATRTSNTRSLSRKLLDVLLLEKEKKYKGGIYHKTQVELTYNSNHMEGNSLTHSQTKYIFETNCILFEKSNTILNVDDLIETSNHFNLINIIIDNAKAPLTEKFIKKLHIVLKSGTSFSQKDYFAVGDYKKIPNEIGFNIKTTAPKNVKKEIGKLLAWYNNNPNKKKTLNDIISFHVKFEKIHPFQDGNGRIGRLIMFKECLKYDIVPFIVDDKHKLYYYRGLKEWDNNKTYLIDTCLTMQDKYKEWLKYFKITYKD